MMRFPTPPEKLPSGLPSFTVATSLAEALQVIIELVAQELEERSSGQNRSVKWLSQKEAAAKIGMDYTKFTRHVRAGEIPSHDLMGVTKIAEHELDEWGLNR